MTVQAVIISGSKTQAAILSRGPKGDKGDPGSGGEGYSTRAAMATAGNAASNLDDAYLTEADREGKFTFSNANLSAEVAADTTQGIYIAKAGDPSGATGAWVRRFSGPADPRWFGAKCDNATNDKTALQVAINVAKYVEIPEGRTLYLGAGAINLPSDTFLSMKGNIRYGGSDQWVFRCLDNISNVTIWGTGTFSASIDLEFLQFFRLQQAAGTTLDGFRIGGGLKVLYTDTIHTGGDRWFVVGNERGTRKHVLIQGITLTGWMQLCASMVSNGTFQDSEISFNRVHNARANPISVSCTGVGDATRPNKISNVKITDNVITADNTGLTSLGIFVGIDGTANDEQAQIQDVLIARNYIDISASAGVTADIWIRLGADASGIGGILSSADEITLDSNICHSGISITNTNPVSGGGIVKATNFTAKGNLFVGGDIRFAYLADGAVFLGNRSMLSGLRPGIGNGNIYMSHNVWRGLTPASSSAEFTIHCRNDSFLGSSNATDRVIQLTATTAKVQTLYIENCTIDSISASPFSGIRTNGLGTNIVHARGNRTETAFSFGLYEQTTGTINDYTTGPKTYTPTLTAVNNCSGLANSKAVYERNENYVRVSAVITGTATAAATSTRFRMSLPIPSAMTLNQDLIGFCAAVTNANNNSGYVNADATNDEASVSLILTASGAFTLNIQFQYQIK